MSIDAMLGLLPFAILIVIIVCWVRCLGDCDWDNGCDESQCHSCPFPCDKHEIGKW